MNRLSSIKTIVLKVFNLCFIMWMMVSCSSDEENDRFVFGLDNSYRIESSDVVFESPNGYEAVGSDSYAIVLNDGSIGDELLLPCCNSQWTYDFNPTTEVSITFGMPKGQLQSGVYTHSKDATDNDFNITIINNMRFESPSDNVNTFNYNPIAGDPYRSTSDSKVCYAELKLLMQEDDVAVDYRIETANEMIVVGSFKGKLSSFMYVICNSDCD